MSVIPKELFLFSQIFGVFPLTFTRQTDHRLKIQFSYGLLLKCLILLLFLTASSYFALYKDYLGYLAGRPIRMSNSTLVLPVMVDVSLLNLISVLIFYSVTSNHSSFIQMCRTLERVDRTLRLDLDRHPRLRLQMLAVFTYVTTLVSATAVARSRESSDVVLYLPFWMTYYIVATLLLQFPFVVRTLADRFHAINERIEEEVTRHTFEQLLTVDLGLSKSNVKLHGSSSVYPLRVLTDCYSEIFQAVQQANSFYRSQVLATVSSSLVHNIITLYFLIRDLQQPVLSQFLTVQFAWALSRLAHIVLLLWPCASLTEAAGETGPVVCRLITRDMFNPDITEELKVFLLKLRHYRVEFSALGFFPIHRSILTSLASSVATYLVVMLQFADSGDATDHNSVPGSIHTTSATNNSS